MPYFHLMGERDQPQLGYCELNRGYSCHDCVALEKVSGGFIDCHNNFVQMFPWCSSVISAKESGAESACLVSGITIEQ